MYGITQFNFILILFLDATRKEREKENISEIMSNILLEKKIKSK